MTRTERQKECVRKWLNNKGIGVVLACTGFGFKKKENIFAQVL